MSSSPSHRGRRLRFPVGVALILAAGAGLALGGSKPSTADLETGPITVDARPIGGFDRLKREATRFGRLTWRGGLVLTSPSKHFGGWSGLAIDPDGKGFFAISDIGAWMSGALTYDGKGLPQGMTAVRMGAIQSKDGDTLSRARDRDAEGLALVKGTSEKGSALISFERKHRIVRFDIDAAGLSPARGKVSLPKSAENMPANGGFEGIAVLRGGPYKGKLVAFSERMRDEDGNHVGWIWEDDDRPRKFYLTNDGDYDVTDAAPLPDGGLLVLERRFRWSEGVSMRLRLIKQRTASPAPGDRRRHSGRGRRQPRDRQYGRPCRARGARRRDDRHDDFGRQLQSRAAADDPAAVRDQRRGFGKVRRRFEGR